MSHTEKQLLKAAQAGDSEAFGALYGLYATELYRYALVLLANQQAAEDAVQETCLKVFRNVTRIRKPDRVKAYFFKTLQNTARTLGRRQDFLLFDAAFSEALPSSADPAACAIDRSDLQLALTRLSDEERQIVLLSAAAGFSSAEIAEIVGLTAGGVRSKLSRALKKLRADLSEKECAK